MITPYSSTSMFFPTEEMTTSAIFYPEATSDDFFENHQKWKINRQLDLETGSPTFHLIDPYGISHALSEFIVDNVNPEFSDAFSKLSTFEEQQEHIHNYLQERLSLASPYQLHVESHKNQKFIHFGDYGLKGGGRFGALLLSLGQIILGIGLNSTNVGDIAGIAADTLIHSGISGGTYVLQQQEAQYEDGEYAKQTSYGAITGLISSGLARLTVNAGTLKRIACQALGVSLGNATALTAFSLIEKKEFPDAKAVFKKSAIAGIGSGVSSGTVALTNRLMKQSTQRVADSLPNIAIDILKKTVQGSLGSSSSKIATNVCEGRNVTENVIQSGLMGGLISGSLAAGNTLAIQLKIRECRNRWMDSKEKLLKILKLTEPKLQEIIKISNAILEEATKKEPIDFKQLLDIPGIILPDLPASEIIKWININYDTPELEAYRLITEIRALERVAEKMIKSSIVYDEKTIQQAILDSHDTEWLYQQLIQAGINVPEMDHSELLKWTVSNLKSSEFLKFRFANWIHVLDYLNDNYFSPYLQICLENKSIVLTPEEIDLGLDQSNAYLGASMLEILSEKNQLNTGSPFKTIKESLKQMYLINLEVYKDLFVTTIPQLKSLNSENHLHLLPSSRVGVILEDALKPKPVSFIVPCTMDKLIPHVVLVQALEEGTFVHYADTDYLRTYDDPDYKALCCIKGVITPEGRIGHHLSLDKLKYKETMPSRPHLHWSWNQLVQPNTKDSWETSQIAIFEPLSTFEDSTIHKPFGIAPYDTFTLGEHHLSEKSTLLIPINLAVETKHYLNDFKGKIVTYDPSEQNLRSAVIGALNENYPDTWHICDGNGEPMGKKVLQNSQTGFRPETCLKKEDGEILCLITNEGRNEKDKSETMKSYSNDSKRFIGLHAHSITVQLEDNPYFKALQRFTSKHENVKNDSLFVGKIKPHSAGNLGSLAALDFYQNILRYNKKTGVGSIANYVIDTALHADLVSLFFQMHPHVSTCDISPLELNMIFSSTTQVQLLTMLADIREESKKGRKDQNLALDLYREKLKECLINMQQAKKNTLEFINTIEDDQINEATKPLCLSIGQDVWEKIKWPSDRAFDLGKNWPLNENLFVYVYKILRTMPADAKELKALYRQLTSLSQKDNHPKEQYRLNILCNVIEWAIQEKFYLKSQGDKTNSILANKLSKVQGWLRSYHLETNDFTQKPGNCLFDNVVSQMSFYITPQQLRENMVDFMSKQQNKYGSSPNYKESILRKGSKLGYVSFTNWEEYLKCMKMSEVFATELEIEVLAEMLKCPIVLINRESPPKIYNPNGEETPIFLHSVEENFFASCVPTKGLTPAEVYPEIKKKSSS